MRGTGMYLENRLNDKSIYLVNEISNKREDGCCWTDCSQEGFKEYGDGNKMFLFEGMGVAYQPFVLDLIHANSKEDAEAMVKERYGTRLKYKTLIRKHEELVEVIDARQNNDFNSRLEEMNMSIYCVRMFSDDGIDS